MAVKHALLRLALLTLAVAVSACAATALTRGHDAEHRQDYDAAVVDYTKALQEHPDNASARAGLERVKLRASQDHFTHARRLAATNKLDEALVEYQIAADLNPTSGDIQKELRTTREQLRTRAIGPREDKTELEALIQRARDLPPPGIDLPQGIRLPASVVFSDASSRLLFQAIGRFADIGVGFDPAFRDERITLDLRNASLEDALKTATGATHTFYRVTAPRTILIVPDTPAKRSEYEEEVVQPFYLSNADLKETMDLLRMVLDARRISPVTANNVVTIKDTPERVAAAARLLAAIDKAKPEVLIDVELLEVDRTRLQDYGLQFASPGSPPIGIDGSVGINTGPGNSITLQALRSLSASDVVFANLPSLYYRLLRSDTNTRVLANPQLRITEGSTAQARFGDRIPVPTTTFAAIATGGVPQQPITSYQYENIGVNLDITPRAHHDDDVTIALRVVVQSVSGTGFGGLPTFGNREVNTVIRLRDGETNMLGGLIRDDERRVVNGIPGLSDIPAIGRLFAHTHTETNQSDIILTLTPHIIRVLDVKDQDLRAFRVGKDSLIPGGFTEPAPIVAPDTQPPIITPPPPVVSPPVMVPPGTPPITIPPAPNPGR